MKHPGDSVGAWEFVHVSEMSKYHLGAVGMELGPASRVVASVRPAGSSDQQTGGFFSTAASSQTSWM